MERLPSKIKQLFSRTKLLAEQVNLLAQQVKTLQVQVASFPTPPDTSPAPSYAEIAKTPPVSQQVTRSTLPTRKSGLEYNEVPYCTIDISRVEEKDRDIVTPGAIR